MENEDYVFSDGKIVKESEVSISIRCKAFNYGLACFEGIRAYWDEESKQLYGFRMLDHYKRLLNSCKTLNIKIPYTAQQLCDYTAELLKKNHFTTTTYIRPIAYKGSNNIGPTLNDDDNRVVIYCRPLNKYAGSPELNVAVSSWVRVEDDMIPARCKPAAAYMNSGLASMEAAQNGFDEALFMTRNGHICEGPGENIFVVKNGELVTPPPSDNILEGITRATVMQLASEDMGMKVVERSINRTELYACDEVFFSGTAMEVTPIVSVDRRVIGTGHEGPVCKQLKKLFFDMTVEKNPKYVKYCTPIY